MTKGRVLFLAAVLAVVAVTVWAGGYSTPPIFPPTPEVEGCEKVFEVYRRAGSLSAITEVVRGPGENVQTYDCDGHVTIVRRDY